MSRSETSSGKGAIGFIIALLVFGYAVFALYTYFPMRVAHYEMKDNVVELLKYRGTQTEDNDAEGLKRKTYKTAKDLGIPFEKKNIRVTRDQKTWRIRLKYQRDFKIPGITKTIYYEIDEKWSDY